MRFCAFASQSPTTTPSANPPTNELLSGTSETGWPLVPHSATMGADQFARLPCHRHFRVSGMRREGNGIRVVRMAGQTPIRTCEFMSHYKPAKPFYGVMRDGIPVMEDPDAFQAHKDRLEGKRFEIYLTETPDQANSAQHRYYRGCVVKKFSVHTGHGEAECHALFKKRFEVTSTAYLSKEQFTKFIDDCIQLCAEYGCVIEDPRPR